MNDDGGVFDGEVRGDGVYGRHRVTFFFVFFTVIIVGGGPAGCSTALSICRHTEKKSVLLLDDANPSTFKVCRVVQEAIMQLTKA
jgi:hypothetical protein